MKKIEAIIRKSRFEDVKKALLAADIEWFSYYNVRGEGKMRQARIYRGVMYDTSSIERVLLNIVVRDKNVEPTIAAIQGAAQTGEVGDGRIFVIPVLDTECSILRISSSRLKSSSSLRRDVNLLLIFLNVKC